MKLGTALSTVVLLTGAISPALGFSPNGCARQRSQYPVNWNNTADETPLFECSSAQAGSIRIKIGKPDGAGRSVMSLVPISRQGGIEAKKGILRIWLDAEQAKRLRAGKYFATVLRKEESCWIRGDLDDDAVFLMDNSDPRPDDIDAGGSFYNKAPRFSVYGGSAFYCKSVK